MTKYSIVVPVYNRPDEVEELLESLTRQELKNFDVVIVEDGSSIPCKEICNKYSGQLEIHYYDKPNEGPGQSRNYGVDRARGEYVIILDSDVVLPEGYLKSIDKELADNPCDAFGGPDRAHPSFTKIQKAISYSMTSFFTTGGIRGGKKKLDKFYPRSFNMGLRHDVYDKLGGFSNMRFGEDIDFSIRVIKGGYKCRLFPESWVWHKRRTDFKKFFRQVFNSGIARINLHKRHPGSLKLVHLLPAVFTIGTSALVLCAVVGILLSFFLGAKWLWLTVAALAPLLLYSLIIAFDAKKQFGSWWIGCLSVVAAYIQLLGYGSGFLTAWWKRCIKGQDEFHAFSKTFYK